jgi:hypothetical protein
MENILEMISLYLPVLLIVYYAIGKVGEQLKLTFVDGTFFHAVGKFLEWLSDFLAGNRAHKKD